MFLALHETEICLLLFEVNVSSRTSLSFSKLCLPSLETCSWHKENNLAEAKVMWRHVINKNLSQIFLKFVKVTFHFPEGNSFQLPSKLFQALKQKILYQNSVLVNKSGNSLIALSFYPPNAFQ